MERLAYSETKVDRPMWDQDDQPLTRDAVEKSLKIPEELKCPVCQELFKDAVMMPCCAQAVCDECARNFLIHEDNPEGKCVLACEDESKISPEDLIPNRSLRNKVNDFRNSHHGKIGEKKAIEKNRSEKDKIPPLRDIPGITVPEENNEKTEEKEDSTPLTATPSTPKGSPTPDEKSNVDVSRPPPGYDKKPLLPNPAMLPTTIPSFLPPTSAAGYNFPPTDNVDEIFQRFLDVKDRHRGRHHYDHRDRRDYRDHRVRDR